MATVRTNEGALRVATSGCVSAESSASRISDIGISDHVGRVEFDFLAEKINWTVDESPVVPIESMRLFKTKNETLCYQNVSKNSVIFPRGGLYLESRFRVQFFYLTQDKNISGPFTVVFYPSAINDSVLIPKCCVLSLVDKEGFECKINTAIDYAYHIEASILDLWDHADMRKNKHEKMGYDVVAKEKMALLEKLSGRLTELLMVLNEKQVRRNKGTAEL